jgi:hypothetical protein
MEQAAIMIDKKRGITMTSENCALHGNAYCQTGFERQKRTVAQSAGFHRINQRQDCFLSSKGLMHSESIGIESHCIHQWLFWSILHVDSIVLLLIPDTVCHVASLQLTGLQGDE